MKFVVLFMLIIGGCYFSAPAMSDYTNNLPEDEIGERWVGRIQDMLKEPFMTLLATSEFITKKELKNRIDQAFKAITSFKAIADQEIVPLRAEKMPPVPAPQQSSAPAPQPSPALAPMVQQAIPSSGNGATNGIQVIHSEDEMNSI